MHKKFLFQILGLFLMIAGTNVSMQAFSSSNYTSMSKLGNGLWVKIAIPENGIYQLTFDELRQMGIGSPENVRLYGFGGHPISEVLNGNVTDDIEQVPIKVFKDVDGIDDKIVFYGKGPVKYTLTSLTTTPRYEREFNSYSQYGYYFITDSDDSELLEPTVITNENTGTIKHEASLDYYHHEKELISVAQSGKDMLGELMDNASINFNYSLPGLCGDSTFVVNVCAGAKVSSASNIYTKLNGRELNFKLIDSKIYAPANTYVSYNYASPSVAADDFVPEEGDLNIYIYHPNGSVTWSRLDYFIFTYFRDNDMEIATDNQLRMGFAKIKASDYFSLSNATPTTQVWNISNPQAPVSYTLTESDGEMVFSPNISSDWAQFIAFDPSKNLKSIVSYENVENQNIHGMATPDMVIVTVDELEEQAERVADMHRQNDNMIVHVLKQKQIFNEFSSGTPDAMAIRLMNKMFYDRNKNKFKYLLMFGAGSFDNRQILAKHPCTTLTYESNVSNDEDYSYVSDDFFGLLDDNSGSEPASDYLRLGVGRMPCASVQEAETDVNKLLKYVNEPDYGFWRNDALFISDDINLDAGLHAFQTEGINNLMVDSLATGLMNNKIYVSQFPNDPITGNALEARKKMTSLLKDGQFFTTYVGHAGGGAITHDVHLWTYNEVRDVKYTNLPIMTTACCNVARYDSNNRGMMEMMFHKEDGGAIALLTSARAVYATDNDALNQAFVNALFCYNTKGYMPSLGEAYMLCKNSFKNVVNWNKMSFLLLGDPAMKVKYPKPFFKITKINGNAINDNSIINSGAMQEVTVEAKVYNPDGTAVNTNFNGDATLSIYDYEKKEASVTQRVNRVNITRDIYFPRDLLTRVNGRVVNGVFTAKAIIPRYILSTTGSEGAIKVYAHQDNSDEMVNGSFKKLRLYSYNENNPLTVYDSMPPVIESIYFNDENAFANGSIIPANSTLYIRATDDYAFNTQALSIGNNMRLILDGGKTSYPFIRNYSTLSDEGKALAVTFPMDLQEGKHTLQYTVYDAAGNSDSRTISFLVGTASEASLSVEQEPAVTEATFNLSTPLTTSPSVTIKVLDTVGNLVWSTTTTNFPYNWDLKDNNGNRVPAGVYKFFGTYNDGNAYGGTEIGHLIVIEPYKSNN